jgi:cupin fold WbuC family metalloprotein
LAGAARIGQNTGMKLFSRTLFDELAAQAAASPRQRVNHNVHAASSDLVQRFFVAANRGTYFRVHRHLSKSELALVMRGRFDVLTFDDNGTVVGRYAVGEETPNVGFETPRATWHTLISHTDGGLFFEVKEGPYDQATAAEFAPWAPPEGHSAAAAFLEWTRAASPGDRAPGDRAPGDRAPGDRAPGF